MRKNHLIKKLVKYLVKNGFQTVKTAISFDKLDF